jgi:hypothetical protein
MYLCDGWSTIVEVYADDSMAASVDLYVRARSVKLPALNGGPPIDTHTMYNQYLVTKAAQGLAEYEDMTMQVQYDIWAYSRIDAVVLNQNKYYKIMLPDKSAFRFWGCMYKFDPAELRKGEFPLAEVTIGLLNRRGTLGTETGPTIDAVNTGSNAWPPENRPRGTLYR